MTDHMSTEPNPMTVAELIEALQALPPGMEVSADGCCGGCIQPVVRVDADPGLEDIVVLEVSP